MINIKLVFTLTIIYLACVLSLKINQQSPTLINLKLKNNLIIRIKSNPSIGIVFYLNNAIKVKTDGILVATNLKDDGSSKDFEPDSKLPGSSGYVLFKFLANKKGITFLQFVSKGPNGVVVSNAQVKVTVN